MACGGHSNFYNSGYWDLGSRGVRQGQGSTGIAPISAGTGIGKNSRDRDFARTGIVTGTGIVIKFLIFNFNYT